jgi:hypothetical protein
MLLTLFACEGGRIALPDRKLVLVSRQDGGNLCVIPPREVWERCELTPVELTLWSFLVAAAGKAMLDSLPQLAGGCVNYWEAGNWALHDRAEPAGPKTAKEYRKVHLHLLGRSRTAADPSWKWGEAPKFPNFVERHAWASEFERLSREECRDIVAAAEHLLQTRYGLHDSHITPNSGCRSCGYPTPKRQGDEQHICEECRSADGR